MHSHDRHITGRRPHGRHGFMGRFGSGGGLRAARMFASGDLQLIILALLDKKPRHGYEVMKALEEHSYGVYIPSPGVVYPAFTYLEEMGFAVSETEGNKKLYKITDSGKEHLAKNRELVDESLEQLSRYGRRMARVEKQFSEEDAENAVEFEGSRASREEWRKLRLEFRELRETLRDALHERMDVSIDEQKRLSEILKKTIKEVRNR
jgi:DNA-binding PadR family transcriptional regulator